MVKPSGLLGFVRDLHLGNGAAAAAAADAPIGGQTADNLSGSDRTAAKEAAQPQGWPLEQVLRLVSENPAVRLGLKHKGRIGIGLDADLLLLAPRDLALR